MPRDQTVRPLLTPLPSVAIVKEIVNGMKKRQQRLILPWDSFYFILWVTASGERPSPKISG